MNWKPRIGIPLRFRSMQALLLILSWTSLSAVLAAQPQGDGPTTQVESPKLFDEGAISVSLGDAEPSSATAGNGELASPNTPNSVQVANGSLVSSSLYIRVILILGFLIILIYFTLKFLRRLSLQKPNLQGLGTGIRVLSSQVLYSDRMLHIVEVGGECYLLGTSSSGVQLLDHYTEQEVKDRVILEVTQRPNNPGILAQGGNVAANFLQLVRSRLNHGKTSASASKSLLSEDIAKSEQDEGLERLGTNRAAASVLARTSEYRERMRSAATSLHNEEKEQG